MKVGDPGSTLTCTTEINFAIVDLRPRLNKDYRLVIVDTPGFDDPNKKDSEVLNQISIWLHKS
jgi:GTPase Era involved in 16S rRNA processing